MAEIVGVEIKQEQDPQAIFPEQVWLEISSGIIKTDLDDVVKSEDQYCMSYDNCSNNLLNENELFLKEENARLEVTEGNLVNKIDIDQHETPMHVILKRKEDYEVTDFKGETDLNDIVVKSEEQFCVNCDENSSDNVTSENGLVLKDSPSVEAVHSSGILGSEYISSMKKFVNKINHDQQSVSRQTFFQENAELQTDVIKLKRAEKEENGNRNKTSKSKKKRKCHCCDRETGRKSNIQRHDMSTVHVEENVGVHYCQQCTYKTVRQYSLSVHLRMHEGNAPFKCPGCQKSFNQKLHLDNHLLKNHDNLHHLITCRINYCKFCAYKTFYSKNLIDHIAHNHDRDSAEKFHCHKCDYFALKKCNLKRHLLVHSNTRPYLCTLCKREFIEKVSLDSHILNKHKENADLLKSVTTKLHQCTFCTYKTVKIRNFRGHIKRKHT